MIGVDLDKYFKGPPLRKKSVPISTEQEPGKIPQRSTTTYGTTQVPDIASDEPRQPFKPADIFYKEAIEAHNKTFYGEKHNKKTGECDLDGVLLLDAERNLRAAFRLTADTFGLEDERSATAFSNLLRCYLAMGIAREGETEELINSPEVSPPPPPASPLPVCRFRLLLYSVVYFQQYPAPLQCCRPSYSRKLIC